MILHLRALKSMCCETSILELKLDASTSFEWQKFSHDLPDFSHYGKLLEFLNLRAQASEVSASDTKKHLARVDNQLKKGANKLIHSQHI